MGMEILFKFSMLSYCPNNLLEAERLKKPKKVEALNYIDNVVAKSTTQQNLFIRMK